jgi:hypothetical protein
MEPEMITIGKGRCERLIAVKKAAQRAVLSAAYDFATGEPLSITGPISPVEHNVAV